MSLDSPQLTVENLTFLPFNPHVSDGIRGWPYKNNPLSLTLLGKFHIFRQKPITGMHCLTICPFRNLENFLTAQVTLYGWRWAYMIGLCGLIRDNLLL